MSKTVAHLVLPTNELRDDIPFFTKTLGMRMDMIYPADDPTVAHFSGHGLNLRIEKGVDCPPGSHPDLLRRSRAFCRGQISADSTKWYDNRH